MLMSVQTLQNGFAVGTQRRFISQTASRGRQGEKLGRAVGTSLEFMDYREYLPGDDLRHIDWNAFGRTDKLIVKRFQDEIRPHVDILLDVSKSMAITESKRAAALFLTGFFMGAAENSGFTHTLWKEQNGFYAQTNYRQLIGGLDADVSFESTASLGAAILNSPPEWNPQTFKIILSDFFWEEDPFSITRRLGANGVWSAYIEILDSSDAAPELSGDVRLTDCESGEFAPRRVDSGLLKTYTDNLRRHRTQWNSACHAVGAARVETIAQSVLNAFNSVLPAMDFIQ